MNAIEFGSVHKTYDNGVRALDGLSMAVPAGSIFGFLGLNGAGKTTTIRMFAGLARKDSGTIKLFDKPMEEYDYTIKRRIGFVLDEPLYFDWMTARDYLTFLGNIYSLPAEENARRVEELIDFFDLHDKEDEQIRSFSTGMKKKISLAAAIIHAPDLIVLDEPLEGIDALAAVSIKETLLMMASRGATIFITSHVLGTVEELCSEIGIIHKGRMIMQCPTSHIRQQEIRNASGDAYASLEELFIDVVSEKMHRKHLPYLEQ